MLGGSDSEGPSGVATALLAELESDDRRIRFEDGEPDEDGDGSRSEDDDEAADTTGVDRCVCFEDAEPDEDGDGSLSEDDEAIDMAGVDDRRIRFENVEPDEDGDGSRSEDDDEAIDMAGVIARCAMLFGIRFGRGAIFLRGDDFAVEDAASSVPGKGVATSVAGVDVGSGEANARFREVGVPTVGGFKGFGTKKRRGAGVGRTNAARGAANGFVVMKMVAAERSGFGGGVDFLLDLVGFRGSRGLFFLSRFLGPSLTLIRENKSINSSKFITGGRLEGGLAGRRFHCGGEKLGSQPSGNGSSSISGGYTVG